MTASKQLQDWLTRRDFSTREFAERMGVTRTRIYQLLEGRVPSLHLAARIEHATGIPAAAWIQTEAKR